MSFFEQTQGMDWDDTSLSIYSKTTRDVVRALNKSTLDLEDFKALISPAAENYLEEMAQKSFVLTRKRFGNIVGLYAPLYLSNLCSNVCTYCGFSMDNRIKRKVLNEKEIKGELDAIKRMKFDNILLVTGEHEAKVGFEYLAKAISQTKDKFSYVNMEVQPLEEHEYKGLVNVGLDGVMIYQETYNSRTYSQHHLRGRKADYQFRIETPDRLARVGIDKIGLGVLIGLDDWRTDSFYLATHLNYLEKRYWRTRYSISFPRIRPCESGFQPKSLMTDRQLVQLICAYRLFNNEVELSLSTRESERFRDNAVKLGITNMSAGSKTQPGGYANNSQELEQFSIDDSRTPSEVALAIERANLVPVWKDWDSAYSG
ncbi:2-iminoacetate synthase ThiH [Vibrio sp. HN007]|uniref:2-iminoacetate synthase ThiH n=1 Tax=Vibrio iocasae TaxID=3098914 RepID=UPI0035D51AA1